ncbi:hypothetical protein ACB092_04G026300 [Castanea dentata]
MALRGVWQLQKLIFCSRISWLAVGVDDAIEQLERNLSMKVKKEEIMMEKGVRYLEENQLSDQVGVQRLEMLKVRVDLEERLKQEGILSSRAPKADNTHKRLKPVSGRLMTYDDFDDDTIEVGPTRFSNGHASSLSTSKLSQIKVVSGDDDLPKRDAIGERWRKLELRVVAGAGIKSENDFGVEVDNFEVDAAVVPSLEPIDGKCHITYQMEKNTGLTRKHKNQTKNCRKYKVL